MFLLVGDVFVGGVFGKAIVFFACGDALVYARLALREAGVFGL